MSTNSDIEYTWLIYGELTELDVDTLTAIGAKLVCLEGMPVTGKTYARIDTSGEHSALMIGLKFGNRAVLESKISTTCAIIHT